MGDLYAERKDLGEEGMEIKDRKTGKSKEKSSNGGGKDEVKEKKEDEQKFRDAGPAWLRG